MKRSLIYILFGILIIRYDLALLDSTIKNPGNKLQASKWVKPRNFKNGIYQKT